MWKNSNGITFNTSSKSCHEVAGLAVRYSLVGMPHLPISSNFNFDAEVDVHGKRGVMIVILRDINGSMVDWSYCLWDYFSDPLLLEGLAC